MPRYTYDEPILKESRTEYLLYVPYALRHQARRVEGRRWDPVRKCWAFPKTSGVLRDLRLEFGEDLVVRIKGAPAAGQRRPARWPHLVRRWLVLAAALAAALMAWAVVYWIGQAG